MAATPVRTTRKNCRSITTSMAARFTVVKQGYDCAAVDEHIAELEREMAELDHELADLRGRPLAE